MDPSDPFAKKRARVRSSLRALYRDGGTGNASRRLDALATAAGWRSRGPGVTTWTAPTGRAVRVAGRVTAIALHRDAPDRLAIGTAGGGVWRREGRGPWIPATDDQPSLAIGALAAAPSDANVLFAGTGEGASVFLSADPTIMAGLPESYYGAGILRSEDGGKTWTALAIDVFARQAFFALAIHPERPDVAYAATTAGVRRTRDGGTRWERLDAALPEAGGTALGASDVVAHPVTPSTLYSAVWSRGIYRTEHADGDAPATTALGMPPGVNAFGRIRLALSREGRWLYAVVADPGGTIPLALARYDVARGTWSTMLAGTDLLACIGGQCAYVLALAADPFDDDAVYVGAVTGVHVRAGEEAGARAQQLDVPHWDLHAFAVDSARRLYVGGDGGLFTTPDDGATYDDGLNVGMATFLVEGIANDPLDAGRVLVGTVDNGVQVLESDGSGRVVLGGDGAGGMFALDRPPLRALLLTYAGPYLWRQAAGEAPRAAAPPGGRPIFAPPLAVAPDHRLIAYAAKPTVFLDPNGGEDGWPVRIDLPAVRDDVSALCFADAATLFAGTADGELYRLASADGAWSAAAWPAAPFGNAWIASLLALDGETVLVALARHGGNPVWRATARNGAVSWEPWSGRAPHVLPPMRTLALAADPQHPDALFAGTDVGVYASSDRGATWHRFSDGLPNVVVSSLAPHPSARVLRAGTYGRGVWEIALG